MGERVCGLNSVAHLHRSGGTLCWCGIGGNWRNSVGEEELSFLEFRARRFLIGDARLVPEVATLGFEGSDSGLSGVRWRRWAIG